jgi:hypothetical protein
MARTFYNPYERDPVSAVDRSKENKLINLVLDTSYCLSSGETRNFFVRGDVDAEGTLEIKNEDGYYYNFVTQVFTVSKADLKIKLLNGVYSNSIKFPAITDNDQYDITFLAKPGTVHPARNEVRFEDGTIDLNSSTGSNSLILKKVIFQDVPVTLTLSNNSPNGSISITNTTDTIASSRGTNTAKTAFTVSCTSASGESFRIIKQPTVNDILSFLTFEVGSAPVLLPGENQYPAINNTDTVDGVVEAGVKVVMDTAVASKMKVGDRITGNAALNAATVTVVALNPDGDNVKEFSMSEAIGISDGVTLSFSNQKNFQWPMASGNISKVQENMILVAGTNVVASTTVSKYEDTTIVFPDTVDERTIVRKTVPPVNNKSKTPTITRGEITTQLGNIVFSNQQPIALAGDTIKIGGYGEELMLSTSGYNIKLTDLKIALTEITTTTTSASSASTSVAITERNGIMNSISTVSGIGIDPEVADPTVNSGGNATGAGTIVLSAAQTLESGVTLTFPGAGKVATITGNIEIIKSGPADATLFFDIEKLIANS